MAQKYVSVPKSVQQAAKKGLELRKKWRRGGIGPGQTTAKYLASGKFPKERIKKMFSYLSRHEVDKKSKAWKDGMPDGGPSAGKIAWLLWGGDPGFRWIKSKRKKLNPTNEKAIKVNVRQVMFTKTHAEPLGTFWINPIDFLRLTTNSEDQIYEFLLNAPKLSFFNSDEINGDMNAHPMLEINEDGKITGHEGRNRAAAVFNAGGKKYPISIHTYKRDFKLPSRIFPQFNQETPPLETKSLNQFFYDYKKANKEMGEYLKNYPAPSAVRDVEYYLLEPPHTEKKNPTYVPSKSKPHAENDARYSYGIFEIKEHKFEYKVSKKKYSITRRFGPVFHVWFRVIESPLFRSRGFEKYAELESNDSEFIIQHMKNNLPFMLLEDSIVQYSKTFTSLKEGVYLELFADAKTESRLEEEFRLRPQKAKYILDDYKEMIDKVSKDLSSLFDSLIITAKNPDTGRVLYSSLFGGNIKKNPTVKKGEKVVIDKSIDENILFRKLPEQGFFSWEPGSHILNLFDKPENVSEKNAKLFPQRTKTMGGARYISQHFKTFWNKSTGVSPHLIGALLVVAHDDKKEVELVFGTTRPGWKKQHIMKAMVEAAKREWPDYELIPWEPTKAGKAAFAKIIKNPRKQPNIYVNRLRKLIKSNADLKRYLNVSLNKSINITNKKKIEIEKNLTKHFAFPLAERSYFTAALKCYYDGIVPNHKRDKAHFDFLASLNDKKILKNPVDLTDKQFKNYMKFFEWIIKNEFYGFDQISDKINTAKAIVHTQPQMDTMLRLASLPMLRAIHSGYTSFYGMDIPYHFRYEAFKRFMKIASTHFTFPNDPSLINKNADLNLINMLKHKDQWEGGYKNAKNYLEILEQHAYDLISDFQHWFELMRSEDYKPLLKAPFNEKMSVVRQWLEAKEAEINAEIAKRGIKSIAKPNKEFLTVHKNLKWFLVDARTCPYESEAMGHCGVAESGCQLLSLREFSDESNFSDPETNKPIKFKQKIWVPRVTATVCRDLYGKGFVVQEILGPQNYHPDKKWEGAIYKLYKDKRIIAERKRGEEAFMTEDLSPKKQTKLMQERPEFEKQLTKDLRALKQGTDEEVIEVFYRRISWEKPSWIIKEDIAYDKEHKRLLVFRSEQPAKFKEFLLEMPDAEIWRGARSKYFEAIETLFDAHTHSWQWVEDKNYYVQPNDIDENFYIDLLNKKQLIEIFGIDDKDSIEEIPDELLDIMVTAQEAGYRRGEENHIYESAEEALLDIRWYSPQNDKVPIVFTNYTKGYAVWFNIPQLRKTLYAILNDDGEDAVIEDNILDHVEIEDPSDWNDSYDFDETAAEERFRELIFDQYGV